MRFISKYEHYSFQIRPEEVAFRMMTGGTVVQDVLSQPFVAEFSADLMIPAYERLYAMQVFMGRDPRPFGAIPDTASQAIVDHAGRVVDMTAEYRPDFHFSVFDTESIDDDDLRELTEQKMMADPTNGIDYVMIEAQKVPAPWPTYDENDLATAINMMKHGGYDMLKVMEYEQAHQNREEWIVEMGKILADQTIQREIDGALSVTI